MTHDRQGLPLVAAGKTQHPPDVGYHTRVVQEVFRNDFARSGSPGIITVSAKSPGSPLMCA